MISLNIRLLLKNKILWAWPILAVVLALLAGWYGVIQSAGNSYTFLMTIGDSPTFPSGFIISGLFGFFILIAVIGIPSHFNKNLDSQRASLILSKPITRTDFFFAEFASVMSVAVIYTIITDIVLAVLLWIEAGIFPFQLYLATLLYIPLYIFVIYVSIVLLLVLTHSYLASVLIGYLFIGPISGFLFNAEVILNLIGFNSEFMLRLADGLSYFIPSTRGVEKLMSSYEGQAVQKGDTINQMAGVLNEGFAAFDWSLLGFVLISCVPFFLLSYYLMRRKQF